MEPLISIITVTYNAEQTIGKTIASVGSQSFRDFEHIIIDGDSKDFTLSIIASHLQGSSNISNIAKEAKEAKEATLTKKNSKPYSPIVFSEPDKGLYDAMNKGLKLAKGKYVLFLNAGDTFHSNDTLAKYAEATQKDADIIYGDTVIVNPEGRTISRRHLSVPELLTKKSFSKGMLICHQAFMVKKELTGEYNLGYKYSADFDWCVKCIGKSKPKKCYNLRDVTIDFLSDGLTDRHKWESLRERFKIMTRHYGFLPTLFNHLAFIPRTLKRGKI